MEAQDIFSAYIARTDTEVAEQRAILQLFGLFPGQMLTRENTLAHCTASSWITDETGANVVMAWHNIYKSWSWTGGHADGDADLLHVALKEALEETGLRCVPAAQTPISIEVLPVNGHFKKGKWVVPHLHINATYHLFADTSLPLKICEGENSAVQWMKAEEALEKCTEEAMIPIYKKLIERTKV